MTNYGTRTQIDGGNLNPGGVGLPNGQCNALSAVDNHAAGNDGYLVDYSLTCSAAPTSGNTITFYLIQAPSVAGSAGTYTDSIAPGAADVAPINAIPVRTLAVNTTTPYAVAGAFRLPVPEPAPFWTLLVRNGSGVALADSGNTVVVTPITH